MTGTRQQRRGCKSRDARTDDRNVERSAHGLAHEQ
jgi:hypothetical protein